MSNKGYEAGGLPLPPYGVLTDGLQEDLNTSLEVPADVCIGPDSDMKARLEWWREWKNETKLLIARTLWPEWDVDHQQWCGNAVQKMYDLTAIDLDIVAMLRATVIRQEIPNSPLRSADCPVHEAFYRSEDDNPWFAQYKFYDSSLSTDLINTLQLVYDTRAWDKYGSSHLQFKMIFQRPRPSQTVYLLKKPSMRPFRAISAGSPSLCSGHSLQALLGVGAVIEHILLNDIKFSPDSWHALHQHAVDIGDRRVFAGVHYPGDNIASWIIAMRLASHVFRTAEVKKHLWDAISLSRVHDAVSKIDVYQDALRVLEDSRP
jgi:PAP2 superfamily protein